MRYLSLLALVVLVGISCSAFTATLNVPGTYTSLQSAIAAASDGDTIQMAAGTFVESGQVVISKNLTIIGAGAGVTIIKPAQDTGSGGDARGWFLVAAPNQVKLSQVTLDGSDHKISIGILSHGSLSAVDCAVNNMGYNPSGPDYAGRGIAVYDGWNTITRCAISNAGRIGFYSYGASTKAALTDCTYVGKGAGNWLDYGIEVEGGAAVTASNCQVSGCTGVATVDGSGSAGVLATTYFAAGTSASFTGCTITGCSAAIVAGYDSIDTSSVTVHASNLAGNSYGVATTNQAIDAKSNWWGTASGPTAGYNDGTVDASAQRATSVQTMVRAGASYAAQSHATAVATDRCIGSGSWRNSGTATKGEFYITPAMLLGHGFKVSDIASISYMTKKSGAGTTVDWGFYIYTTETGTAHDGTWYGYRLTSEPMYSVNLDAAADNWNKWQTDAGVNQMRFYDSNRTPQGWYTSPTFAQVCAGPVNWHDYWAPNPNSAIDYASQDVLYISLQVGSAWSSVFTGMVDGLVIRLKNGEKVAVDFESDSPSNLLYLAVDPASLYVKQADPVSVALKMSDMSAQAAGYQAFMSTTGPLTITSSDVAMTGLPFGLQIFKTVSGSDISLSGLAWRQNGQPLTNTAGLLARMIYTAGTGNTTAGVHFGSDSAVTDGNGNFISTAADSIPITVDNTAPSSPIISVDPATTASHYTAGNTATISFSSTDAVGIDHYEISLDRGAFAVTTSPYLWTGLSSATHTVDVKAVDLAGNTSAATTSIYVDTVNPTINIDSITQSGTSLSGRNAIQGAVTITVSAADASPSSGLITPPAVQVTDANGVVQTLTAAGSGPWTYTYTVSPTTANGIAAIAASVSDAAGNSANTTGSFNVNKSAATLNLQLAGVNFTDTTKTVTRPIRIIIGGTTAGGIALNSVQNVTFDYRGLATVQLNDLSNEGTWTKVSAKDEQHTLLRAVDLTDSGNKQFAATLVLDGGDATNDNLIDIRDFGVFAGQYGTEGHPYSTGRDADFSCNGRVWTEDFTFLQSKFLRTGDTAISGALRTQTVFVNPALSSITVAELGRIIGSSAAKNADVNKDGIVDTNDIRLFVQSMTVRGR